MANSTERCFTQHAPFSGPPLIQNGQLTFQAYDVGWIAAGIFTVIATAVSFWLIGKHLMWYTNKRQQRYIIRLLLMVPIYATVSLASFIFWNHAIPITLIRDSYESFVLYSFFYLLLQYLSPTVGGQKDVFRNVVLQKWMFPLSFVKYRPKDGLYFLQLMKWGVLQYCIIRPATTLAAVVLDSIGLYCDDSWSPGWGHIYITIIVSLSVTIAMYCLIQLYIPIADQLAPHKPLLKLVSVKAVVFLTFWQSTALSALSMFGVVKDTNYMTADDINTGIAAIIETFEMMCFAGLHIRAFSYLPYRPGGHKLSNQTPRFGSLMHALDIREMWREIRDGSVYMGRTIRGVEAEAETRRRIHFSKVMGHERKFTHVKKGTKEGWPAEQGMHEEEDLLSDSHRGERHNGRVMWLSEPGDRFGGAFEDEVEKEMRKRELATAYGLEHDVHLDEVEQGHRRGEGSWWRDIYHRVSQTGPEQDYEERPSPISVTPSPSCRKHRCSRSGLPSLDSPPPLPSILFEYSDSDKGRSGVLLSPSHRREQSTTASDQTKKAHLGYQDNNSIHPPPIVRTPRAQGRKIIAPRPVSTSQGDHMAHLISSKRKQLSPSVPPQDENTSRFLAPSGIIRSDSLLARVFPNSTSATTDGDRTEPASSQDTHSSPAPYPPLIWPSSHESMSPPRGTRTLTMPAISSPSFLGLGTYTRLGQPSPSPDFCAPRSPRRGQLHPRIILPTPLSPARYSVETPHHALGRPMPQNLSHHPMQRPHGVDQYGTSPQPPAGYFNLSSAHPEQLQQDKIVHRSAHSQIRSPPTQRLSIPTVNRATPHRTSDPSKENVQMLTPPSMRMALPSDPSPALAEMSARFLSPSSQTSISQGPTTPPSSYPPRLLRHTRGTIGEVKRPWS